jgi:L-lactate dehydrogenase complex protein LldE
MAGSLSRQGTGVHAAHLAEVLASTRDEPWSPTVLPVDRTAAMAAPASPPGATAPPSSMAGTTTAEAGR